MSRSLTRGSVTAKRSRHSRPMRNPEFYVSGQRPILQKHAMFMWTVVRRRHHSWKYYGRFRDNVWSLLQLIFARTHLHLPYPRTFFYWKSCGNIVLFMYHILIDPHPGTSPKHRTARMRWQMVPISRMHSPQWGIKHRWSWDCKSNFIPQFTGDVIINPYWD